MTIEVNADNEVNDTVESNSWLDNMPDDIRGNQSLSKFKDVTSLAQSYLAAEKALSSRVAIPADDADEEQWGKFYQRLGVPEDKIYTSERKGEDEKYIKDYEEMFFSSGISKRQGEKLLKHLYDYSSKLQQENRLESDRIKSENFDWLKSNYGNDFDVRMSSMQAALKEYGSKELADMLEDNMYAPALVDMLAKVGSTLKSDSLVTGEEKAVISEKDSALREIKALENDNDFMVKLANKNHAGHDAAVARMTELHSIAYK